jgi:hypothetical protein
VKLIQQIMESTVKQRIVEFLKSQNITVAAFERRCRLSNGYMKLLKDRPSNEKVNQILEAFPQLNRVWLLSGEGSMLNDGTTVIGDNNITANNVNGNNEQGGVLDLRLLSVELVGLGVHAQRLAQRHAVVVYAHVDGVGAVVALVV